MVPVVGVEPTIPCGRLILSQLRMPVPPHRQNVVREQDVRMCLPLLSLEAQMGFAPMHRGFADRCVTTSPLRQLGGKRIIELYPVVLD